MVRTLKEALAENLQDGEFARGFGAELAKTDLGMLLVRARKAKGITRQELAAMAGFAESYIARLESGEANPPVGRIGELLALLGFCLAPDLADLNPYAENEAV
jgi:transcriptional regulator with XRE-family HTH domain